MSTLKELRLSRNLKQAEVSKIIGASQGSIAQWEAGQHIPRIPTLVKLAGLYGCTVDELVRGFEQKEVTPK